MNKYDKYLVIYWNRDEEEVRVSRPLSYKRAMHKFLALDGNGGLFEIDGEGNPMEISDKYKNWSKVITKYEPLLEKDMWNEL